MALTDSLISYWKMDEASGDAVDAHGSSTLSDNNTVTTGTGIINGARLFTAANLEYLSHVSSADLQTGNIDFTFALWVKPAADFTTGVMLAKDGGLSNTRDYTVHLFSADPYVYFNGGTVIINVGTSISSASWSYVVAWHDAAADTLNIQLNNGTVHSTATSGTAPDVSDSEFRIGASAYSGSEAYFNGMIDEVGFWKRTLTTQERTDLYNSGAGLPYSSFGGGAATVRVGSMLTMFQ